MDVLSKLLNKLRSKLAILLYDGISMPIAWFLAHWLMYNLGRFPFHVFYESLGAFIILSVVQVCAYYHYKLYRGVWRYSSLADLVRIIKCVILSTLSGIFLLYITTIANSLPRSVLVSYTLNIIMLWCGGRLFVRWLYESSYQLGKKKIGQRVLIVGAGHTGESLAREMKRQRDKKYYPVGFVDDNLFKTTQEIHGVRVLGQLKAINEIISRHKIDLIIIAMASIRPEMMREIYRHCEGAKLPVRILPSLKDVAEGCIDINALREVSIEDLLGREQVQVDWQSIQGKVEHKRVLVTGGGGSIGSELCRQIAALNPESLSIIDSCEYNLYTITHELNTKFPNLRFEPLLANITDKERVKQLVQKMGPQLVFHAAAYKHVPILEQQVEIAIQNNVLGTRNIAEAAVDVNAEKFILISTDKAVNPSNIMGASKRVSEIFCQNINHLTDTQFITVRFGNVLGSSGSVLPLFKKQLKAGQALTVTHPDITRYFMTIPEACQLILQASSIGEGGEIFVLDMGKPVKISYLAEQLIKFSGKKPGIDVEIQYIGLRPGEKLYEELFHEREKVEDTQHEKIYKAKYRAVDWQSLYQDLQLLDNHSQNSDVNKLLEFLSKWVPESSLQYYPVERASFDTSHKHAVDSEQSIEAA